MRTRRNVRPLFMCRRTGAHRDKWDAQAPPSRGKDLERNARKGERGAGREKGDDKAGQGGKKRLLTKAAGQPCLFPLRCPQAAGRRLSAERRPDHVDHCLATPRGTSCLRPAMPALQSMSSSLLPQPSTCVPQSGLTVRAWSTKGRKQDAKQWGQKCVQ